MHTQMNQNMWQKLPFAWPAVHTALLFAQPDQGMWEGQVHQSDKGILCVIVCH